MNATITEVTDLPLPDFGLLVTESTTEGFRFVDRLQTEWQSGVNRFGAPGEALFVARIDGALAGICGLNRDPYAAEPRIGRLRHLYVRPQHRRLGIGRQLVEHVIRQAQQHFDTLTLRTDSLDADAFYLALGFKRVQNDRHSTHRLVW